MAPLSIREQFQLPRDTVRKAERRSGRGSLKDT
jgi:hypothetical protein